MTASAIGAAPIVAPNGQAAAVPRTAITLPSGRQVPIEYLVQRFLAEFIRITEQQVSEDEAALQLERSWKTAVDAERTDELQKARHEAENLRFTGKVREYGLGGTLALSGIAQAIAGHALLGGAGIIAGTLQMLNQYFDSRGTQAVTAFFGSFLPVSEGSLTDAAALFTTFASAASTLLLPLYGQAGDKLVQQALAVATGTTRAAFDYAEGRASDRRDEHRARSIEIDAAVDMVGESIQNIMDQIGRSVEQIQQFQRMQIELAQKEHSLKSNIFSMAR